MRRRIHRLFPLSIVFLLIFARGFPETRKIIAGERYRAPGDYHEVILGKDYRELWLAPIEVEVLDLQSFAQGLRPVRRVGGFQTLGLALVGADGKSYTFRSVDKNPAGVVPLEFRGTIVEVMIQDQMAASHPAGALIASELARAAGVLQTEPTFVIMPEDPALGEFLEDFGGVLGTLEEYPTPASDLHSGFHGAHEIISTADMWELLKSGRAEEAIDAEAVLRARLLDLLIGDWDRHQNQWRWAKIPDYSGWQPIAEDRDQAFASYEGLALWFAREMGLPRLIEFTDRYPKIDGLTLNAWLLDRAILPALEWAAWERIAADIQTRITDEVIGQALGRMPQEYYAIVGAKMEQQLRARRDSLPEVAKRFYLHLAGEVDIYCTDADELIRIERTSNGNVEVTVQELTPSASLPYKRLFLAGETREIRIYLHGGTNRVEVRGSGGNGPQVFVVGNREDTVVEGQIKIYEGSATTGSDQMEPPPGSLSLPDPNQGAPWMHPRDWGRTTRPVLVTDYATDAGLILGAGLELLDFGFKKYPYANRHILRGAFAFEALKPVVDYFGDFRFRGSRSHLTLNARFSGLENLRYYGLGNETDGDGDEERFRIDHYQVSIFPALTWSKGSVSPIPSLVDPRVQDTHFMIGPVIQYNHTSAEAGSVLEQEMPYGLGRFGQFGVATRFFHDSRETGELLQGGVQFLAEGAYYFRVWDAQSAFGSIEGELEGILPPWKRLQLGLRIGGKKVFGDYPFYEAAFLGGPHTIPGYLPNRFAGDASIFANTEIRLRVADATILVPGSFGFMLGGDVGRVFLEGESSGKWHPAVGAGVFFDVFSGFGVDFSVWKGKEDFTFLFSSGFEF